MNLQPITVGLYASKRISPIIDGLSAQFWGLVGGVAIPTPPACIILQDQFTKSLSIWSLQMSRHRRWEITLTKRVWNILFVIIILNPTLPDLMSYTCNWFCLTTEYFSQVKSSQKVWCRILYSSLISYWYIYHKLQSNSRVKNWKLLVSIQNLSHCYLDSTAVIRKIITLKLFYNLYWVWTIWQI